MARKLRFILVTAIMAVILIETGYASSQERIHSYDTHITIHANSTATITETIEVESTGQEIKRGIYRDIPTSYYTSKGNRVKIYLKILSVLRDGQPEPYKRENLTNGIRIRIGRETYYLPPGPYTYTITYEVSRILGFFPEHDELYWNATGNDWDFPIEKATTTVSLPLGIPIDTIKTTAFTGPLGSINCDCHMETTVDGARFYTTKGLAQGEGLSIVIGWPKGFVREPTAKDNFIWLLIDNSAILFSLLAIILPALLFFIAWLRVGRDPDKGIIFPHFTPPENLSPAAVRFIRKMKYDNKVFTAGIINLAVQGRLTISQENNTFSLINTGVEIESSQEENALHKNLFQLADSIHLDKDNHQIFEEASNDFQKQLTSAYRDIYYKQNGTKLLPGLIVGIALLILSAIITFRDGSPLQVVVFMVAPPCLLGLAGIFSFLLKAPTVSGRELMDEIDGFKMYLGVAEKDYLQWSAPPERTPELFEKYLPYAFAHVR